MVWAGIFVRSIGLHGRNTIIKYSLSTVAKIVTVTEGNTSVRGRGVKIRATRGLTKMSILQESNKG